MKRLLTFLHPHARDDLSKVLPKDTLPLWPWYTTVSRLNHKPDAFHSKSMGEPISELITLPDHKLTFSDVMDKRALELLKLDGTIFVMWSGGIDSTGVVSAILKNWPKEDLKRVTILCSTLSIKENKSFFPHIVKNFKIDQVTHNLEKFARQGYIITGELGDQIFGSDVIHQCINHWGEEVILKDWKDIAPQLFKKIDPVLGEAVFQNYAGIVDEAPFELKSTFDFFWWLNFTQKWQHVKYRALISTTWTDPKQYFPKVVHFFEGVDFQLWSIYNHGSKVPSTWNDYKKIAKDYIMDYTNDPETMSQLKIASGPNLYVGVEPNWAIDEDWNFISRDEAFKRLRY